MVLLSMEVMYYDYTTVIFMLTQNSCSVRFILNVLDIHDIAYIQLRTWVNSHNTLLPYTRVPLPYTRVPIKAVIKIIVLFVIVFLLNWLYYYIIPIQPHTLNLVQQLR